MLTYVIDREFGGMEKKQQRPDCSNFMGNDSRAYFYDDKNKSEQKLPPKNSKLRKTVFPFISVYLPLARRSEKCEVYIIFNHPLNS